MTVSTQTATGEDHSPAQPSVRSTRPSSERPESPEWPEARLAGVLANRRWLVSRRPFRHVRAGNVFTPAFYEELRAAFEARVDDEAALHYARQHDFYGAPMRADTTGPLGVFWAPRLHQAFLDIFGVEFSGLVTGGVHRHHPGSRDGFPHNDISPEHLSALPDGEVLVSGDEQPADGPYVRAVAILYYLNNGPWRPGDGGETGLYRHWSDPVAEPAATAPPRDNTLLAFECTPYSYHSFRANQRRRDSIIMFLHRSLGGYLDQWGDDGIAQYADG
jgi:2-oxoglutarate-Fe(II)-dependent oxygenase superfamily protein